nr:uncharacterized protein LOC129452691 [Misgurnus anguillicaudatus]
MASKQFLTSLQQFLGKYPFFASGPASILLYGLEAVIGQKFSCPCSNELNISRTASIFIGLSLLTFALMFFMIRPLQNVCCRCSAGTNKAKDGRKICPKAHLHCLIPPFILIITLLLDGDYLACSLTEWKGKYVFNEEINGMWCKPTEWPQTRKESKLRNEYVEFIHRSKTYGYAVISVLSILIISVGYCNCCFCIKCPDTQTDLHGQKEGQELKSPVPLPNPISTTSEASGLREENS